MAARTALAVVPSNAVDRVSFRLMHADELRAAVTEWQPRAVEELSNLVRIPSIAFPGYDEKPVRESAEATAETLEAAGYGGVRLIELPDVDHPAVFGEVAGPAGAPTILLYAHHDIQPEGPLEEWTSPPFEPEVRDGRLYGRGTSDDKCGIIMHAASLRAWGGKPPVSLKVLVEGEEEASAEHLPFLIGGHKELLVADVIGVADGGNWRAGIPTLETSIRGVVDCIVTVRALDLAVHSGAYGGPAIDAISALARILATLHDDDGTGRDRGSDARAVGGPAAHRGGVPGGDPAATECQPGGLGIDLGAAVVQTGRGRARPGRPARGRGLEPARPGRLGQGEPPARARGGRPSARWTCSPGIWRSGRPGASRSTSRPGHRARACA